MNTKLSKTIIRYRVQLPNGKLHPASNTFSGPAKKLAKEVNGKVIKFVYELVRKEEIHG